MGDNRREAGVTADDEEAAPNDNARSDAVAFASALLGGGYIMDKEGAAPKENMLMAVADPAEAITAGVISSNNPKEKSASGTDESYYYFSSAPLSQETDTVTLLMVEEEDEPKENSPTPLDLGGYNNAAIKEKPPSSYL